LSIIQTLMHLHWAHLSWDGLCLKDVWSTMNQPWCCRILLLLLDLFHHSPLIELHVSLKLAPVSKSTADSYVSFAHVPINWHCPQFPWKQDYGLSVLYKTYIGM
jgi:hypothetical protein